MVVNSNTWLIFQAVYGGNTYGYGSAAEDNYINHHQPHIYKLVPK
jgi:hypothetical protein